MNSFTQERVVEYVSSGATENYQVVSNAYVDALNYTIIQINHYYHCCCHHHNHHHHLRTLQLFGWTLM